MRARNEHGQECPTPVGEELGQDPQFRWAEGREPRDGLAPDAIKTRWNSPYATLSASELRLLGHRVFDKPVRRIRHHPMNRIWFLLPQPDKTVGLDQRRTANKGLDHDFVRW